MKKEIHKVIMLPARFIKYDENDNSRVWIKMMMEDNSIQQRKFPVKAIQNLEKPDYLFVGIITGEGFMSLGVCDALEYIDLFKEKWSELL